MKPIVIYTKTAEALQGIIRGIEALDSNNELGIIHGAVVNDLTENEFMIAELTNATAVVIDDLIVEDSKYSNATYVLSLPALIENNTDKIIDYLKNERKDLIGILINMPVHKIEKNI